MNPSTTPLCKRNWPVETGLRIGAINVCSMPNKLDDVSVLLHNNDKHIHVLGISESRLTKVIPDEQFSMNNYTLLRSDVVSNSVHRMARVGLAVYIHHDISFKRRSDLEHPQIECIWPKINDRNSSYLVGQIYRHPESNSSWFEAFTDMMDNVSMQNMNIILLGDLNINMLQKQKNWSSLYSSY